MPVDLSDRADMTEQRHRAEHARPTTAPARAPLPPPGPQWYGAVMGTGILATLTQTLQDAIAGGARIAVGLLVIGWALLLGLTGAFLVRVARRPRVLADTVRDLTVMPTWGMVSMGILSVGSATAVVVPAHWASLAHAAWVADAWLWSIGTALGVLTVFGFALRVIGRDVGAPGTTWGLPIVPPMVSATTGAALVPHVAGQEGRIWLLVGLVACFFLALFLGAVVFAIAYHHHWRIAGLPLAASATAWIPLGVVGQSTAAAQAIAAQAKQIVQPAAAGGVQDLADVYGYCMLAVGVPLIGWAVAMTVRGFARRMPFNPGWWGLTFPIGTVSFGAHLLGKGSGLGFFTVAGTVACVVLMCTWTLCAVATARAVAVRATA